MSNAATPEDEAPADNPLLALSGTVLEVRYELGRVLGAGGMGAVYEAKHLRLDRKVAIKVLRPVFVGHTEYIKRFLREARVASKIRHRNVVEIHDYGEAAGGLVYSVMEFLHGQDLDQVLQAQPGKRLPWQRTCNLLYQAASGLKAAHAEGIVHRDIKPSNCFLTTDDEGQPLIKIVDFGIAKVDDGDQTQQLTGTAEVLGTPAYIAPELVLTKSPATPRSDIYSLGVVAYRMLAGRLPFTGDTSFQVLHRVCFEPPPPLRELAPDVPPAVEAFVLKMLAKSPVDRPEDMQAVREALLTLARDAPGGQPVEISVSSALPFGPAKTDAPFGPSPDAVLGAPIAPTEILPTPPPIDFDQLVPRAPEASSPGVPHVGAPQGEIHDPSSVSHAHSAQDAIFSSNPTPPFPDAARREAPRKSGAGVVLIALGGLAIVIAAGVVAVQSSMKASPETASTMVQADVSIEPGGASETPPVGPTALDEAKQVVKPASTPPTEPTREPMIQPDPPAEPEPTIDAIPPAEPAVEPEPEQAPPTEPGSKGEKTTKPKQSSAAPSGPPSDAEQTKKLIRRIKSKCGTLMTGQPVKISFIIRVEGHISGLSATPKGPVAQCALEQVKGTPFRKRAELEPIEFTVK